MYAEKTLYTLESKIYSNLNAFSNSHPLLGRLCALPVSIIDIAIETVAISIAAIESIATAAFHLIGLAFSKKCTLKGALAHTESTLLLITSIPVKLIMALPKIAFQFFAIIIAPEKVQYFNYCGPTFKEKDEHSSQITWVKQEISKAWQNHSGCPPLTEKQLQAITGTTEQSQRELNGLLQSMDSSSPTKEQLEQLQQAMIELTARFIRNNSSGSPAIRDTFLRILQEEDKTDLSTMQPTLD